MKNMKITKGIEVVAKVDIVAFDEVIKAGTKGVVFAHSEKELEEISVDFEGTKDTYGVSIDDIEIIKAKNVNVVDLKDVGVDIVKEVGVIEYLEKEIALKNRAIELNRKDGFEMLACLAERELEMLNNKKETVITALELFNNLTWKDGSLYKMENFLATTEEYSQEEHEEWERKVKDPNENGGVL